MVTTAFWVSGYWRTESPTMERKPSTSTTRLTTMDSTGRRMKISVKFMAGPLLLLRMRVGVVGRLHGVVDHHRRVVLQLALAAGDHFVALLQALDDGHLVAARRPGGDEGLLRVAGRLRLALRRLAGILLVGA